MGQAAMKHERGPLKLGVLTGGSDVPGLNSVIRAVVRTAVHRYGDDVVGISNGWDGLLHPPETWSLSPGDVRGMGRRGGTILGSANRGTPFQQAEGGDRSAEVFESARWLGLDGLLCIGGDGSLAIAQRLFERGLPVVGIPKAVANDMSGTDVTFGFATAVEIATDAIDKLQTTRESHHRAMYLEVYGRDAGWIALTAGVAGGADVILIPELPYDPRSVAEVIERRAAEHKGSTIVLVAEGARMAGEEPVDPEQLRHEGGAAHRAAERVHAIHPHDYRVTVLGHLQRGGDPVAQDRVLATRFGAAAVRAAHEGQWGKMVGLRGDELVLVPLAEAVGSLRRVTRESEAVWTAVSLGTSLGVSPGEIG